MSRNISSTDIADAARTWGMSLSASEVETYGVLAPALMEVMAAVDGLPTGTAAPVAADRRFEPPAEGQGDPLNAIVRWCSVAADGAQGPLSGVRLAVKDCIAVGGVPMTGGSAVLQDFVPSTDATVVERALAAGAEIVAVTNMDDLAMSAGGDSSFYGPTRCPYDDERTAGGSSSGSAAALHYDAVDMALGTDTGGSVRVPASWCGVVGFKPSHGQVPFTGALAIDRLFDHVGTLTRSTADAARLLDVIAGGDGRDPVQRGDLPAQRFVDAVASAGGLEGARIGVLSEGFSDALGVERDVADAVHDAVARLQTAGAVVEEVSVPEHLTASSIMFSMLAEGLAATLAAGGNGYQLEGQYWPELAAALRDGLARRASELSPQIKLSVIAGTHMQRQLAGASYATAANARRALRSGYDRALAEYDVLLLPTTPTLPLAVAPELPLGDRIMRSWGPLSNTSATNISGHPAVSLPIAAAGKLPVGVMAVGRRNGDDRLLAFARSVEASIGWALA